MNLLIAMMALLGFGLQYQIWWGQGGYEQVVKLRTAVLQQQQYNQALQAQNHMRLSMIEDLKHDINLIEDCARQDLGMIKKGEIFYHFIQHP